MSEDKKEYTPEKRDDFGYESTEAKPKKRRGYEAVSMGEINEDNPPQGGTAVQKSEEE